MEKVFGNGMFISICLMAGLVSGCTGVGDDGDGDLDGEATPTEDTPSQDTPSQDTPTESLDQSNALVATVSDDYSVGALATIELDDWALADNLTAVSGDPVVVVDEGLVIQLNRGNVNGVRLYEPGDWTAPILEFSTGEGSNPQDARICDGKLLVSLYVGSSLPMYDPDTGLIVGAIDLSAFDDGDGSPEMADFAVQDGRLFLALHRFQTNNAWISDGGTIVELDCAAGTVLQSWSVGPAPDIAAYAPDSSKLVLRTGVYFDEAYNLNLDGHLGLFDLSTGEASEDGFSEAALGVNFDGMAISAAGKAIALASDAISLYYVLCLDLNSGESTIAETTDSALLAVSPNDRGEAWIAARPSWAAPESTGGVLVYDIDQCISATGSDWLELGLAPYSIAFY